MTQENKWLPPRLEHYSEWIEYDGTNKPDDDELGQVMFDIEQCEMDFTPNARPHKFGVVSKEKWDYGVVVAYCVKE